MFTNIPEEIVIGCNPVSSDDLYIKELRKEYQDKVLKEVGFYATGTTTFLAYAQHKETEEVVGVATYGNERILLLYIEPAYRRKGIGKALVNEIETYCNHNNLPPIWVSYKTGSLESTAFFEAHGFKVLSEDEGITLVTK